MRVDSCQHRGGLRPRWRCRVGPLCRIALGSASELEYHLLLAKDLNLIQPDDHETFSDGAKQVKRMLSVLVERLTADS